MSFKTYVTLFLILVSTAAIPTAQPAEHGGHDHARHI